MVGDVGCDGGAGGAYSACEERGGGDMRKAEQKRREQEQQNHDDVVSAMRTALELLEAHLGRNKGVVLTNGLERAIMALQDALTSEEVG